MTRRPAKKPQPVDPSIASPTPHPSPNLRRTLMVLAIGIPAMVLHVWGSINLYRHLTQFRPSSAVAGELVDAMSETGSSDQVECDSKRIAALYQCFADMISEDRKRRSPLLSEPQSVLASLNRIGHLQVGTGFRVGDRYPKLVDEISQRLERTGLDTQRELTAEASAELQGACEGIARDLGGAHAE